jgi:hypothetical protein
MTDFDARNRWLVDRGSGQPSVNLVVLSFVEPLKLLNKTNDAGTSLGIPIGMNQAVVDYFKSRGVRVALSIGGITYTDAWNQALSTNATQLGLNAAEAAKRLGVGMEIDYEESTNPNVTGLQAFINAYRSVLPYDASGNNHAARLTIDLAAGDRWLIALTRKATADWLNTTTPVLDYANAMVPVSRAAPECTSFSTSLQKSTGNYVQTVLPNGAGSTSGMLGYMFWAAECPATRRICTVPPDSCEGGVGVGAQTYNVPIPMPPLRPS